MELLAEDLERETFIGLRATELRVERSGDECGDSSNAASLLSYFLAPQASRMRPVISFHLFFHLRQDVADPWGWGSACDYVMRFGSWLSVCVCVCVCAYVCVFVGWCVCVCVRVCL